MKPATSIVQCGFCILIAVVVSSCVLDPHTTLRSPEVRGRILSAQHTPIQGATVCLTEHPEISCTTDSEGRFLLKATYNHHAGSIPPEGHWPEREYWEDRVTISHPMYISRQINHWPVEKGSDKGDILLEPAH